MVGLGTQDDLGQAKSFLARHKISAMKLLWDKTGKSWTELGIPAQPAWLLLDKAGKTIASDTGAIPYEDVLKSLE